MTKKKLFRITYIIPLSFLITLLVFSWRYMWFGIAVVPGDRTFAALFALLSSSVAFLNEAVSPLE